MSVSPYLLRRRKLLLETNRGAPEASRPSRNPGTLTLLWGAVRPYPGRVATLGVLVLTLTAIQVGVPLGVREVVDRATHGDVVGASTFAVALIAAGLLAQAVGLAEAWVATDLGQRTTNDLRSRLVRLVLGLDGEFHAANPPGALVERVDGDTGQMASLFSRMVVEAAQSVLVLVGTLVMAWTIAPAVAVGLGVTIVLTGAALRAVVLAGHTHRIARADASAALFGAVEERLAGIEDVRASGTVSLASWHVEAAARTWLQRSFGAMAWNAASGAVVAIASGACSAVAFAGAGLAAMRGEASVGDIVALLVYVEVVRRPVEQLARQAREMGNAVAGAARVGELLGMGEPGRTKVRVAETPPPAANEHRAGGSTASRSPRADALKPFPISNHAGERPQVRGLSVELVGVGVTYPGADRAALSDVSMVIPAGAFVGVVGRTGSGKTSFGRVVVRAIAPSSGRIQLGGVDLDLFDEADLRARVAVVGQEPSLFHASVRENVTLFDASVPDEVVRTALIQVGLEAWLEAQPDGLSTRLAPSGGQASGSARVSEAPAVPSPAHDSSVGSEASARYGGLSAGEAQLLALARAFVRDAGLVVLDEPAARVDPVTEVRLVAALRELARGRTVVVVAHRGTTIIDATHLLEIEDGRVIRYGRVEGAASRDGQRARSARTQGEPSTPNPRLEGRSFSTNAPAPEDAAPSLAPSPAASFGAKGASERPVSLPQVAGAIWAIVRGFPGWWVAAITLAGMVGYALTLGSGVIQRGFVDDVSAGAANPWWWATIAIAFGLIRATHFLAAVTVEPWTQSRGAATVAVNAVMGALRTRTWPLLPVSPGDAVGRLRDDAAVIGRFTTYLGDPVGQVIIGGSTWWFLASRDPWLAVGAFAPILMLAGVAQAVSPIVSRARRAASEGVTSVTDVLADAFANAAAIRLAGASERVVAAVSVRGEVRRRTAIREALVAQGFGAAWRHVGTVSSGALLLASVHGMADGSVTAGDAALGLALTQALTFLGEVYGELMLLARGSAVALGRIGALVPEQPLASLGDRRALGLFGRPTPPPPRPTLMPEEALRELSVRGLTFRHCGSGGGIQGASFTVRAGTLVAVTGPAGGGKSTLVRALLGLVPKTGEVWWNGVQVSDASDWLTAPRLAWTPQSPRLFSGSVRENILGVPDGDDNTRGGRDAGHYLLRRRKLLGGHAHLERDDARIDQAVWLAGLDADLASGSLSLDARVGPRGLRLSGGQQQRVAAARMFAAVWSAEGRAAVVVVDDVSSALDEATEAIVWDRVLGGSGDRMTVIAVTNRPSVIARASLVLAVEAGQCRVVREGIARP